MSAVRIRPYTSPSLVLLAVDWDEGAKRPDFLGFAIRRTPGFRMANARRSWLPNRIGFYGPARRGEFPSSKAPIQKFLWWDARIDATDRGRTFYYEAIPVVGTPKEPKLFFKAGKGVRVIVPQCETKDIGSYFNRAVVSSQAFTKKFGGRLDGSVLKRALHWLANGMEEAIPAFMKKGTNLAGAIYHLTDKNWIVPAMQHFAGDCQLVYNHTSKDRINKPIIQLLRQNKGFQGFPRTKAAIMHNKFLVRLDSLLKPEAVLAGSANFTTEGIASQANVIHTFRSPELAELYLERQKLLAQDPTISDTARHTHWSSSVPVGDARLRVFFSPEPKNCHESIDTVVRAIQKAKSSVLFCLFMPTDKPLRDAIFTIGDQGKMMLGLVNTIPINVLSEESTNAGTRAKVEIFHRSRNNRDVFAYDRFSQRGNPHLFWWERCELPGAQSPWPVWIHHKFVIIDAETAAPVIYTGSANMSQNSLYRNDENLLEITNCPRLAQMYLAEFLRLYEHYRARAIWNRYMKGQVKTYTLKHDSSWAKKYYLAGSPEAKARIALAAPL